MRVLVLAVAIVAVLSGVAHGQHGYIGVYADPAGTDCDVVDTAGLINVYIVHKDATGGAMASQFMVDVGPGFGMTFLNFAQEPGMISIGDPFTGIAIGYGSCYVNDFVIGTLQFLGNANSLPCSQLEVVADPSLPSGQVEVYDCGPQNAHNSSGTKLIVNPTVFCPCDVTIEPVILSIDDVGNDQGRQVRISWARSGYDESGAPVAITGYDVYRQQDQNLVAEGQAHVRDESTKPSRSAQLAGWDYIGTHPARGDDVNQMVVPTLCDSTGAGICWSTFMVSATTADPYIFFDSDPAAGYSVDNLAPFAPAAFSVAYNTGVGNQLTWVESLEEDLQYYKVYRGTTSDFTPGPANLVHSTTDTDWTDPEYDGWPVHYKITAVDFNGNESDDSSPTSASGADETVPTTTTLSQNVPNPFNPATTISFNTATAGRATLSIFDASGKHVRTLVDGYVSAGVQSAVWDGRDAVGAPVSSGVYFYRLTTNATTQTRKMVLLK